MLMSVGDTKKFINNNLNDHINECRRDSLRKLKFRRH